MMAHLYRYLDPLSPHQLKFNFGPPLTKLSGSAHEGPNAKPQQTMETTINNESSTTETQPDRDQRGACIKGLCPPLEQKTENYFHQFLLIGLSGESLKCKNFGIYLNFTIAMVTKMVDKICFK